MCINDEEARQLTDQNSLVKAAKIIQSIGPKYVIIKKGEHGALLFHQQEVFCAPALPLEKSLIQPELETVLLAGLQPIFVSMVTFPSKQ